MNMSLIEILDVKERNEDYAHNIFSSKSLKENIITYKLLSNLVRKAGFRVPDVDEVTLVTDQSMFEKAQRELVESLTLIAAAAVEAEPITRYSTGQIARFFGVSQTTISNWISQGRFEGVVRAESGKHVEIPSDTAFTYPSGKTVLVKDMAERFQERQQLAAEQLDAESEAKFIERKIKQFEDKYGTLDKLRQEIEDGARSAADGGLDLDVWNYLAQRRVALGV